MLTVQHDLIHQPDIVAHGIDFHKAQRKQRRMLSNLIKLTEQEHTTMARHAKCGSQGAEAMSLHTYKP